MLLVKNEERDLLLSSKAGLLATTINGCVVSYRFNADVLHLSQVHLLSAAVEKTQSAINSKRHA